MTDTTTITPEERQDWREWLESPISCHDAPHRTFTLRLLTALEAAEDERDRLRAERDWLAENIADRPCAYDSCPFGLHRPTGPDDDDCDKTRAQCWQEAARRAVAESEVKG